MLNACLLWKSPDPGVVHLVQGWLIITWCKGAMGEDLVTSVLIILVIFMPFVVALRTLDDPGTQTNVAFSSYTSRVYTSLEFLQPCCLRTYRRAGESPTGRPRAFCILHREMHVARRTCAYWTTRNGNANTYGT